MRIQATIVSAVLALVVLGPSTALAYRLVKDPDPPGGDCDKDHTCIVYCNDGKSKTRAGSMNWNGTVWTDSQHKGDKDPDVVAKEIIADSGTDCQ